MACCPTKRRRCIATTRHIERGDSSSVVSQEAGERTYVVGMKLLGRLAKEGGRIGGGEGVEGGGLPFRLGRKYKCIGSEIRDAAAF